MLTIPVEEEQHCNHQETQLEVEEEVVEEERRSLRRQHQQEAVVAVEHLPQHRRQVTEFAGKLERSTAGKQFEGMMPHMRYTLQQRHTGRDQGTDCNMQPTEDMCCSRMLEHSDLRLMWRPQLPQLQAIE